MKYEKGLNMPKTYEDVQNMTVDERFALATEAYQALRGEQPLLENAPGDMAACIAERTGVDFSTAAAVALTAPLPA